MIFHNVFSIDEAHNEALKIKRLQNRASSFKNVTGKTSQYKNSAEFHIRRSISSP